jgi:hypothetical protein
MYDQPLTLRTSVPASWRKVTVKQGNMVQQVTAKNGAVVYDLMPNQGTAVIVNK